MDAEREDEEVNIPAHNVGIPKDLVDRAGSPEVKKTKSRGKGRSRGEEREIYSEALDLSKT